MQSVEDKIYNRIRSHGRAWAMSNSDFCDIASEITVRSALYRLKQRNIIRAILLGIYDYPKYSEFLQEFMAPDIDSVSHAIARKFGWRIQISGSAALNYLDISTQVPGRNIYLSDGPNRNYNILGQMLEFKHASLPESRLKYDRSELLVQAIRDLGKENVTPEILNALRKKFNNEELKRIFKDTQYVTGWIYEDIKQICHSEINHG
jgi:hypothetical protein